MIEDEEYDPSKPIYVYAMWDMGSKLSTSALEIIQETMAKHSTAAYVPGNPAIGNDVELKGEK